MPRFTYIRTIELETHVCGKCGILFGMTIDFIENRKEDHATFYCPNGHARGFLGESKSEKLQRELNTARQQIARVEDEARETKRIQKRIHAGLCPCCNRTFQNLARHMATKHPETPAVAAVP